MTIAVVNLNLHPQESRHYANEKIIELSGFKMIMLKSDLIS